MLGAIGGRARQQAELAWVQQLPPPASTASPRVLTPCSFVISAASELAAAAGAHLRSCANMASFSQLGVLFTRSYAHITLPAFRLPLLMLKPLLIFPIT